MPSGYHNGRRIFYIFGRYPADTSSYPDLGQGVRQYPVVDFVLCDGDFLNADREYVHQNRNVKRFGTYGDIMIRDRKMYVAPTPFALTEGTTGLMTLIMAADVEPDSRFKEVGRLIRIEAESLVIGYTFDLRTNVLAAEKIPNPTAGREHEFIAYRLNGQADKPVTMTTRIAAIVEEIAKAEEQ